VKKPQAEKHLSQCSTQSLSCMDCHKDFRGKEYQSHTKCISEEQKYAAAGWKAPANRNKGERKQEAWVETIQGVVQTAGDTLTPAARSLLQVMTKHENVPRKKPKFMNFIQNVGKGFFDQRVIDQVWTLLEEQLKKEKEEADKSKIQPAKVASEESTPNDSTVGNGEESETKKKKKNKKKDKDLVQAEDAPAVVPEDGDGETKSKKNKSKKRKAEDEIEDGVEHSSSVSALEVAPDVSENADGETKSKKKKSKKRKTDDDQVENGVNVEESVNGLESSTIQESEQDLKKKKKKKSKTSEDVAEENGQNEPESNGIGIKEKSSKRKHEDITESTQDTDVDDETRKRLKKQRKAERKAAQNKELTELSGNGMESLIEESVHETPEEIKARQKAERKLARKAAKAASNGA